MQAIAMALMVQLLPVGSSFGQSTTDSSRATREPIAIGAAASTSPARDSVPASAVIGPPGPRASPAGDRTGAVIVGVAAFCALVMFTLLFHGWSKILKQPS